MFLPMKMHNILYVFLFMSVTHSVHLHDFLCILKLMPAVINAYNVTEHYCDSVI